MSINKKKILIYMLNKTLQFVKADIFAITLWRKLTKLCQMTIISSNQNMKYNFSEIIHHVHGYGKWFAAINDLSPFLNYMKSLWIVILYSIILGTYYVCVICFRKMTYFVQRLFLTKLITSMNTRMGQILGNTN